MTTKQQTETKKRTKNVIPYYAVIVLASIAVMVMTVFSPVWNQFPVEITEQVSVIALTEAGAVVETSYGVPGIIDRHDVAPGQTIDITYQVPVKFLQEWDAGLRVQEALKSYTP